MEETIHISFKERKKDEVQRVANLEDQMENLSLNDNAQHQQILQIATSNDNNDSDLPTHQHVSDDISEEPEDTPNKRWYTGARDLRAVSQNQIIGEPSQGIRTRSSLRTESNLALISKIQPKSVDKAWQDQS